ncbi:zinc knuckle family protein [Cryptosporidium andersoni]|uniref:Branchpoint-bridging protein n=1 Tax=Cryptosporidium andersoni TaxID=117008 RepID=A0A1J4MEU2_9CRYT|nr:zinc knuckle family protein [Cryptosporidium andersoni]
MSTATSLVVYGDSLLLESNDGQRRSRWKRPEYTVESDLVKPSRWKSITEKEFIPPCFMEFPPGVTLEEVDQFLKEQRLDELMYKLQVGDLEYGDPDIREPSPPPIYDKTGSRINTRDMRVKKSMEIELSNLIEFMMKRVEDYAPPNDYKPLKKVRRLIIPLDKYPEYNFMGLIIGPRGYNHRRLEAESGSLISIRGKGTLKEGKKCDHQTEEELAMPMHIHISADTQEKVDKAVDLIQPLLDPFHPLHDEYKRRGLEQLAIVNGTNISNSFGTNLGISGNNDRCLHCGSTNHPSFSCPDSQLMSSYKKADIKCSICGDKGHITKDCKLYNPNKNIEEEYEKMMSELSSVNHISSEISNKDDNQGVSNLEDNDSTKSSSNNFFNSSITNGLNTSTTSAYPLSYIPLLHQNGTQTSTIPTTIVPTAYTATNTPIVGHNVALQLSGMVSYTSLECSGQVAYIPQYQLYNNAIPTSYIHPNAHLYNTNAQTHAMNNIDDTDDMDQSD